MINGNKKLVLIGICFVFWSLLMLLLGGSVIFVWLSMHPNVKVEVYSSSDLVALGRQINIPDGTISAEWTHTSIPSGGLVPSPGRSFLRARLVLSSDKMAQLMASGKWNLVPFSSNAGTYASLLQPGPSDGLVQRDMSHLLGKQIIANTTWMKADVFVKSESSTVWLVSEKN